MGVFFLELGKKVFCAGGQFHIRNFGGGNIARGSLGGLRKLAVKVFIFHGEARQTTHFLQGVTVGGRRAFQVDLLEEQRKVGDAVHGDDHVLVHLEAGGALGDGREPVAVFPEALAFLFISGNDDVHVVLLFHNAHDVAHAFVEQVGIVAIHLQDDDRNGRALVFLGLALVFNGLHVLGVELFHGRQVGVVAFLPDAVAQGHQFSYHHGGGVHGAPKEFKHHDAAVLGLGVNDKAGFGNDAVHAFFLHARQAAQNLVGHVLAKARQAYFVAAQMYHVAHAAAHVLDHKDGGFVRQDLVAGVVFTLNGDDFTCGRDHAPPQQVVQRGAVLKGAGAARVFRNVAADGRCLLGSRVNGKQRALGIHGVDDGLRDGPSLTGDCHGFKVNRPDARQPGEADNNRALARGHCAASHAGAAAARNERKLHIVGELHKLGHLLGIVWFNHQQGQFHAQVSGVCCRFHHGGGIGQNAFIGQNAVQGVHQFGAEGSFGLVGRPEHGQAFADGRGVIVRQGDRFLVIAFAHAGAHGFRIDKGVVGHQKKFFGYGDGQVAHRFGPFCKVINIDAQNPVHHIVGRNGDMRTLVGHDVLPRKAR